MRPFVRNAPAAQAPQSAAIATQGRVCSRRRTAARPARSVAVSRNVRRPSVRFVREKRNPIGAARKKTAAAVSRPAPRAARKTRSIVPSPASRVGRRAAHGVSPKNESDAALAQ